MLAIVRDSLTWLERQFANVAAIVLFLLMTIVVADVFLRYLMNRPIAWAYDVISLYMMPAIFYLTLSRAQRAGAHIGVEILRSRFSPQMQAVCRVVSDLLSIALFAAIAYFAGHRALDEFNSGSTVVGEFAWITWPTVALAPLGAGMIALSLAIRTIEQVLTMSAPQEPIRENNA